MKIELSNIQISNAYVVLNGTQNQKTGKIVYPGLRSRSLPALLTYKIRKLSSILEPYHDDFIEVRAELEKKYIETDENGSIKIKDEESLNKEYAEVGSKKEIIEIEKERLLTLEDLENLGHVDGGEMEVIMPLIIEG